MNTFRKLVLAANAGSDSTGITFHPCGDFIVIARDGEPEVYIPNTDTMFEARLDSALRRFEFTPVIGVGETFYHLLKSARVPTNEGDYALLYMDECIIAQPGDRPDGLVIDPVGSGLALVRMLRVSFPDIEALGVAIKPATSDNEPLQTTRDGRPIEIVLNLGVPMIYCSSWNEKAFQSLRAVSRR